MAAERCPTMSQSDTPEHITETARAIVQMHTSHRASSSAAEQMIQRIVAIASRPTCIVALAVAFVAWIVVNLALPAFNVSAFDPPPFPRLDLLVCAIELGGMMLILTTQRQDDDLALRREQVSLELALLNDRKLSKVIELLERARHDSPNLPDVEDDMASALAEPSDPQALSEAIQRINTG